MNLERLLRRIASGSVANVDFTDFQRLLLAFGFRLHRTTGSHHLYFHPSIPDLINVQPKGGDAKPYQVRQFLKLAERYNLRMQDRP